MEEDSKRVRTSGRARGTVVAAEQRLHNEKLVCVLEGGRLLLACDPRQRKLLDDAGFGTLDSRWDRGCASGGGEVHHGHACLGAPLELRAATSAGGQEASPNDAPVSVLMGLEEATYLAERVGCLAVLHADGDRDGGASSPTHERAEGREAGRVLRRRLLARGGLRGAYRLAAFMHLRGLGWLVRSGALVGGDWVVYRKHPEACHSLFVVHTVPLPEGRLLEESDGSAVSCGNPQNDMDARVRVARAVRKKLLMLYVRGDGRDVGSEEWEKRCEFTGCTVFRQVPRQQFLH